MQTETIRRNEIASNLRQSQLMQIMEDAVEHVLERDDNRRGPYVFDDDDLRESTSRKASRAA